MGNICVPADEASKIDKEINDMLRKERKKLKEEVKLLLLGPGESGKSTFFKQMKIIQVGGGYTQKEKESFRPIIYNNLVSQMKVLIGASAPLNSPISEANLPAADIVSAAESTNTVWSTQLGEALVALWQDPGIQGTYGKRFSEENQKTGVRFHLNDTADYFFNSVPRYMDATFIPTEEDVLRARVRSTGIEESMFKFQDLEIKMVDVGGQRSERRKWASCFDSVTAILYICSLSEYDQYLREEDTQPRMHESIFLFEEICNTNWFANLSIILFLNKKDLFAEKITHTDLRVCFEEYDGGCNYENAEAFIRARFLERNQVTTRKVYVHTTCAVDTENIEVVWAAVRKTILDNIISNFIPVI